MLAERLGLNGEVLWFQYLKRDGHTWQKGNASMRLRPGRREPIESLCAHPA